MSRRPVRFWIALLLISMAINLLFLGVFLGRLIAMPASTPEGVERPFVDALDGADRRYLRRLGRTVAAQSRDEREAHRQARQAVREALTADPYDAIRVDAAFAAERAANARLSLKVQSIFSHELSALSVEQREKVAAYALSRPRPPRRSGRR